MLLRDGATLVRHVGDVTEALGLTRGAGSQPALPDPVLAVDVLPGPVPPRRALGEMADLHGQILARLGPSPLAEDQLIRDLAMPPSILAPALVSLELEGRILRAPGGLVSRAE
jgi:DNA processing protein